MRGQARREGTNGITTLEKIRFGGGESLYTFRAKNLHQLMSDSVCGFSWPLRGAVVDIRP